MLKTQILACAAGVLVLSGAAASGAQAQELTHKFINPAFGGNPFYSDHLLATANIDRPKAPKEPTPPAASEEELIARQIRGRFLSNLSFDVVDAINAAKPGESGEFVFGDQRINFTKTTTETRITFTNTRTGEVNNIVIPVRGAASSSLGLGTGTTLGVLGTQGSGASPEQALGAAGASPKAGSRSSLLGPPPLTSPRRGF